MKLAGAVEWQGGPAGARRNRILPAKLTVLSVVVEGEILNYNVGVLFPLVHQTTLSWGATL